MKKNTDIQKDYDVIVIGAGASGLIASGKAAEAGAKVLLIEKMKQAGRKLLITGKGRCNITNNSPQSVHFKNIYPNGRFLKHAYANFFNQDIVALLEKYGTKTKIERGERIFPESDSSKDVLNALLKWNKNSSVDILYQSKVNRLLIENNSIQGVEISTENQTKPIKGKNVIICTGGKSYPATGSTGDGYFLAKQAKHSILDVRPSLVPLVCSENRAEKLQGLSLKNTKAIVWANGKKQAEEFGELLFTHFGLSGPIILTLSKLVVDQIRKGNKIKVSIDLKPALDEKKLDARLLRDLDANGKKQIANIFKQWLPSKLIPVFLNELKINGDKLAHQITSKERRSIMLLMKNLEFNIIDYQGFKEAIITAGGVSTAEIDSKTMESKLIKNLYFAGEVIDLDANTGGFNLQIAFSTGWLAGKSCLTKKS